MANISFNSNSAPEVMGSDISYMGSDISYMGQFDPLERMRRFQESIGITPSSSIPSEVPSETRKTTQQVVTNINLRLQKIKELLKDIPPAQLARPHIKKLMTAPNVSIDAAVSSVRAFLANEAQIWANRIAVVRSAAAGIGGTDYFAIKPQIDNVVKAWNALDKLGWFKVKANLDSALPAYNSMWQAGGTVFKANVETVAAQFAAALRTKDIAQVEEAINMFNSFAGQITSPQLIYPTQKFVEDYKAGIEILNNFRKQLNSHANQIGAKTGFNFTKLILPLALGVGGIFLATR